MAQYTRSYITLRQTVGWIGILLPISLLMYSLFAANQTHIPQPSVSLYYHTPMRDTFVGALCAVGLFMFYYTGYSSVDNWTGNAAGVGAIVTAFCYTEPIGATHMEWYNIVHWASAGLLFLSFVFFALVLFPIRVNGFVYKRGKEPDTFVVGAVKEKKSKRLRRKLYYLCGVGILLCIVGIITYAVIKVQNGGSMRETALIYTLEAVMLVLFGLSWIVKGRFLIFDDKNHELNRMEARERLEYEDRVIDRLEFEKLREEGKVLFRYRLLGGLLRPRNPELDGVE